MGKFDGFVLCSDIDGTLITTENEIHPENIEAIRYFQKHGGKFTVATGRMPFTAAQHLGKIHLDLPAIVLNGCAIYDFNRKEYLWVVTVDDSVEAFAREVIQQYPTSAAAIVNLNSTYFLSENRATANLRAVESMEHLKGDFDTVAKPWVKVLFCQEEEQTVALHEAYKNSDYAKCYKMVQSGATYYEIFNKSANKGRAAQELAKMAGFSTNHLAAIGDNENDKEMLKVAKYAAIVQNANPVLREVADFVSCSNNEGGVAGFIYMLDELL